jgi:actin related protein 2/3 complex subunit 3
LSSFCDVDEEDIIDETLQTFKANILFRNFEVKGNADRLLIYLTLYVSQCLRKIQGKNKADAGSKFSLSLSLFLFLFLFLFLSLSLSRASVSLFVVPFQLLT